MEMRHHAPRNIIRVVESTSLIKIEEDVTREQRMMACTRASPIYSACGGEGADTGGTLQRTREHTFSSSSSSAARASKEAEKERRV